MSTPSIGAVQKSKMSIVEAKVYTMPIPTAPAAALKAATQIANAVWALTTQPPYPANLVLTFVDTNGSLTQGTVTVVGLDQDGVPVTEVFTYTGVGAFAGSVAFSKVVSVTLSDFATIAGADETLAIALGTKIGLPCGMNGRLVRVFKSVHHMADEAVGTVNSVYKTIIPTNAPAADHNILFYYLVAYDLFMG